MYWIPKIFTYIFYCFTFRTIYAKRINQLINIGFSLEIKHLKTFDEKIVIAEQAIKNGITISNTNRIYEDIDFYAWIKIYLFIGCIFKYKTSFIRRFAFSI